MRSRSPADGSSPGLGEEGPGSVTPPGHAVSGSLSASSVASRLAGSAPAFLAAVAEGAWIAVIAAAVVTPIGGPGPAGELVPSILAALLGFAGARLLPGNAGRAAVLAVIAGGVVTVAFVAGRPLGLAAADGPQPVASYVVLGFAALRGAAQGDPSAGAHAIETLVRRSPALLGGAWVLGLIVAGEGRAAFATAAALDTLVFVVTASLALGGSRLAALPPEVRHDLGGNGAWLGMVGVVVAIALLLALPIAAVVGGPIGTVAAVIAAGASALVLGIAGAIVTLIMVVVDAVASLLRGLLNLSQVPPTPPPPIATPEQPLPPGASEASSAVVEPIIGAVVIAAIVLLALYLARRWQGNRRPPASRPDVPEARGIDLGGRPGRPGLRLPRRLRSLFAPDHAVDAYPRLLADWSTVPDLVRDPAETPTDHAARLRAAGRGDLGLDLLAADYQLSRFGSVRLSPAEERRAVDRYRRLRSWGRRMARTGGVDRDG
jgi:hypothetical protein